MVRLGYTRLLDASLANCVRLQTTHFLRQRVAAHPSFSHARMKMLQRLACYSAACFSRRSFRSTLQDLNHIHSSWRFSLAHDGSHAIPSSPRLYYTLAEALRLTIPETVEKLKGLGAEQAFTRYDPQDRQHVIKMNEWYSRGPPPLSDYLLTFGKYRGKPIDRVPDVYLVKYLIPRREELPYVLGHHDPIVFEAVGDYMRRNPDVKSQAGRNKTKVRESGIAAQVKRKRNKPTLSPELGKTSQHSNAEESNPKGDAK